MYHTHKVVRLCLYYLLCITLLHSPLSVSAQQEEEDGNNIPTYDYIVVGLGQGGTVAAARLAESGASVLGIEWGDRTHRSLNGTDYVAADLSFDQNGELNVGRPFTRFDVPGFAQAISGTAIPPYPSLPGIWNGVRTTVNVAKHLGGTAAHNGMGWIRHTKYTMDSWGVKEWTYAASLPFFKKTENASATTQKNFPQYHGLSGPIRLSDVPNTQYTTAVPYLLKACTNMGYPPNPDFNGAVRFGCGTNVYSIGNGVRYSSAQGYLPSVMKTGKLVLALKAKATQILIKEGPTKNCLPVAYGIKYFQDGVFKVAHARKEIVLGLSAIFTPQLLLLSGIGPAEDLARLNIKVWVNNKNVGKHLHGNHVGLGAYTFPTATFGIALDVSNAANQYAFNRTGPWATGGQMVYAWVCSKLPANKPCANPDILIGSMWGGDWGPSSPNMTTLGTQISTSNPKVRGTVTLRSADPFDLVNITLDSYQEKQDLDAMVAAWKLIRTWLNTPPAADVFPTELFPGPAYQSDEKLAEYTKRFTRAGSHWTSSVKFGNSSDTTRVLDPQLRVLGITGLRVGDGSIFPSVDSHLQSSAAMAGERVADFILNP